MAYELRDFSDVAPATTIGSDITNVSTTITIASGTGYPSGGAAGDFIIQVESELMRISSRSGSTLTVSGGVAGRGINGTTAVSHVTGVAVNHVYTATNDAKEANYAVSKTVGKVTASQDILVADALNSFTHLPIGANGTILQAVAGAVAYAALPAGSVGAAQITDGTVGAAELAAASVIAGKIGVGGVSAANQFAAGVVDTTAILDGTIVDGDVAAANKDGAAGTASMRTIGTGATQAAAGNDARLSDTRTPTNASVTLAKFASTVRPITIGTAQPGSPTAGDFFFDTDDYQLLEYTTATTGWRAPWNLPWGVINSIQKSGTDQTIAAVPTDISNMTLTWPALAGRAYRVTANLRFGDTTGTTYTFVLANPSNSAQRTVSQTGGLGFSVNCYIEHIEPSLTTGSISRKVRVTAGTGGVFTGTGTSATVYCEMAVHDMGPISTPA